MDYAQILSQLALGSHPQTTDDIDRLKRESDASAVLNLQTDDDMRAVGVAWKPLEEHYRACGIPLRVLLRLKKQFGVSVDLVAYR